MSSPYLVSVRLMVYNHEVYIHEAIEGILKQKTNFLVEVVIGDDFSTDKSLEIIREYQNTTKIHFKILERKEGDYYWQNRQNRGRLHNFYNIIENCTGKYIALLDGDDYWTDPLKLQKQVNFLEKNDDFSISCHRMKILKGNKISLTDINSKFQKDVSDILHLAKVGNFINTASVVFKKPKQGFPEWLHNLPIGDYPLHLYNAQFGKINFMKDLMGVYRIHEAGVWGQFQDSVEKISPRWIQLLEKIEDKFSPEVNKILVNQKKMELLDLYKFYCHQKNNLKALETINQLVGYDSFFVGEKLAQSDTIIKSMQNSNSFKLMRIISKLYPINLKNIFS